MRKILLQTTEVEIGKDVTSILAEAALAEDWLRPEEDGAWAFVQPLDDQQ